MDIKRLSPQNLFLRFVATLLVWMIFSMTDSVFLDKNLSSYFVLSLVMVIIFSILMMLFYIVMVQYFMKKDKPQLLEALFYRSGSWLCSLCSVMLVFWLFKIKISGLVLLAFWVVVELVVYLAQWLFGSKRRRDDGR